MATIGSAAQGAISEGLNAFGLPAAFSEPLSQKIVNWVKTFPGTEGLDTTLYSEKTRTGDYNDYQNRTKQLDKQQFAGRMANLDTTPYLTNVWKWLNPEKDYDPAKHGGMGWEDYAAHQGQGMAAFVPAWILQAFDPENKTQYGKNMAQLRENLAEHRNNYRNPNAYALGEAVTMGFNDAFGQRYDQRMYSGIDQPGVAYLASYLAKTNNYLRGVNINDKNSVGAAVGTLNNHVRSLAYALSPLKDMYGADIPTMVENIEHLAGRPITSIDPNRLRWMAETIASRTNGNSRYITDLATNQQRFKQLAKEMGIRLPSTKDSFGQALRALDAAEYGTKPSFMDEQDWQRHVTRRIFGAHNSGQADALNKAYAMWNMRTGGSIDQFRQLMSRMDTYGMNPLAAAMRLAGARTIGDLDRGGQLPGYTWATNIGMGGDMCVAKNINTMRNGALNMLAANRALRMNTGTMRSTNGAVRKMLDAAVFRVQQDPELANMDWIERRNALMSMGYNPRHAHMLSTSIEAIRTSAPDVLADVFMQHDRITQLRMDADSSNERRAIENMVGDAATDAGAALSRYIQEGVALPDWTRDEYAARTAAAGAGPNSEYYGDAYAAIYGQMSANADRRLGAGAADGKTVRGQEADAASSLMNFVLTDPRAKSSRLLNQAMNNMYQAKHEGGNFEQEKRRYAATATFVKYLNQSALENFMDTDNKAANDTVIATAADLGSADPSQSDYMNGLIALMQGNGSMQGLSPELQRYLAGMGFGADAATNMAKAKLDVLDAASNEYGTLDVVLDKMFSANVSNVLSGSTMAPEVKQTASEGMQMYDTWLKLTHMHAGVSSFNRWLADTSAYGGARYKDAKDPITYIFNTSMQAVGMDPATGNFPLKILEALQQLFAGKSAN